MSNDRINPERRKFLAKTGALATVASSGCVSDTVREITRSDIDVILEEEDSGEPLSDVEVQLTYDTPNKWISNETTYIERTDGSGVAEFDRRKAIPDNGPDELEIGISSPEYEKTVEYTGQDSITLRV